MMDFFVFFRSTKLLFTLTLVSSVLGPTTEVVQAGAGRTGAQILNLGGGTRAASLGDAFSAINGDVTAPLWNPSGLNGISKLQTTLSYKDYSQLFGDASEGLYYAFFAGATHLDGLGTVAGTLQVQGQGKIAVTTNSPEVIREEDLGTNWVLTASYADKLTKNLAAGISGKVIRQRLAQYGGRAYAVDFGIQYDIRELFVPVRFGVALQNWGTRIKFKDENQSDPLPRALRIGTLVTLLDVKHHYVSLVTDLTAAIDKIQEDDEEGVKVYLENNPDMTRDQLMADRGVGLHAFRWKHLQKSIGLEYTLGKILYLRAGYKKDPGMPTFPEFTDYLTYGFGARVYFGQLDFAQVPGGGPNNKRLNVFALRLIFD